MPYPARVMCGMMLVNADNTKDNAVLLTDIYNDAAHPKEVRIAAGARMTSRCLEFYNGYWASPGECLKTLECMRDDKNLPRALNILAKKAVDEIEKSRAKQPLPLKAGDIFRPRQVTWRPPLAKASCC